MKTMKAFFYTESIKTHCPDVYHAKFRDLLCLLRFSIRQFSSQNPIALILKTVNEF